MDKPQLSILMLVSKNQENVIRALDSLEELRKRIPCQLILVDTGCGEDLHRILEERGDVVTRFTWCQNFAKARNAGLALATGEWFLYLDDDEYFEDIEELVLFFTSGVYRKFGFASYIQRNYRDLKGATYTDNSVGRMARITAELRFEGCIHEYMTPLEGEGMRLKARVGHYGYVFGTEEKRREHFRRNASLLAEMMKAEPNVLHWGYQIIQEYRAIEEWARMIPVAAWYLPIAKEQKRPDLMGTFYIGLIMAYKGLKEYDKALEWTAKTLADNTMNPVCHAYACNLASFCSFELGDFEGAKQGALDYLDLLERLERESEGNELLNMMDAIFVGEALEQRRVEETYSILICADLLLGSTEALREHMAELHWDTDNLYVYEHMAEVLILAFNTYSYRQEFYDVAKLIWSKPILKNYFISQIDAMAKQDSIDQAIAVFRIADEEVGT